MSVHGPPRLYFKPPKASEFLFQSKSESSFSLLPASKNECGSTRIWNPVRNTDQQFIYEVLFIVIFLPRSHHEAVGAPRPACEGAGQEAATLPDASPLCYSRQPTAVSLTPPASEGGAAARRSDTAPGRS